ncbi:hypothetical protein [Peterkaempfera sp. SMS 1(5)a]|uniref:hypothetical protein n=1 Tax=Peterkaempfera podocarpi TaxID=3232308 RepID=UPI0036705B3C
MSRKSRTSVAQAQRAVRIGPLEADSRYRLVSFDGSHWEPMEREEFEARVRMELPGIDPHDPEQISWDDHPGEWPAWHPGEA